jgi:hypothetical protein
MGIDERWMSGGVLESYIGHTDEMHGLDRRKYQARSLALSLRDILDLPDMLPSHPLRTVLEKRNGDILGDLL